MSQNVGDEILLRGEVRNDGKDNESRTRGTKYETADAGGKMPNYETARE